MLIKIWFDFAYALAGFACGLFLLFEGTRRIRVNGLHRKAALMASAGAIACLVYVGSALWFQSNFGKLAHLDIETVPKELPDGWGANMPPEKREEYSLMLARELFNQSGTFGNYFDRDGVRKPYSPTEKDIRDRDILHSARDQFAILARVSERDAVVLVILMFAAVIGGSCGTRAELAGGDNG
jgi:hypothetical protein